MNWEQLAEEHKEWEDRNFPNDDYENSLFRSCLGVLEELGELAHARLKREQGIRGEETQHVADEQDAVADMTIYLLGVMHKIGKVPEYGVISGPRDEVPIIKTLAHEVGKLMINPSQYMCEKIVYLIEHYCIARGWDYETLVRNTWSFVKQRDWVANPQDGS
jgi:NTP pyrophosphatase (non-canonical NTP hydrolase)